MDHQNLFSGPPATVSLPLESLDVPAGVERAFAFGVRAGGPGVLSLLLPVQGSDEVDGRSVSAQAAASVTVLLPARLFASPQPAPDKLVPGGRYSVDHLIGKEL